MNCSRCQAGADSGTKMEEILQIQRQTKRKSGNSNARTIQILTIAMEDVGLITGNGIGVKSGDESYEDGREKEKKLGSEGGGGDIYSFVVEERLVVRVKDHRKRAWCIPPQLLLLGD